MTFPIIPASTVSGGYRISRSLRFRSSATAYLSRTPATTSGSSSQIYTWSGWVKLGYFNVGYLISATGNSGYRMTSFMLRGIGGNGALEFEHFDGTTTYNLTTSAVFRDPSAWYHIVLAVDSTQGTNTNRTKIYVNGVQQTVTGTYLGSGTSTYINTTNVQSIGRANNATAGSSGYFDGYMAEVNFLDGYPTVSGTTYNATTWAALNVSSLFGAFDTNGVWQPKAYTGTYGTNGFYLPFTLNNTSTYAGSFNGSSKYLTTPTSSNLAFGTGDFTIEGWFNQTTLNNCGLVCQDYATGVDIRFNEGASNAFGFYINSSSFVYGTYTSAFTNQWHHFALVRSGSGSNNVKLYLDGVVLCQTTSTANLTSNQFRIGANLTGGTTPAGTYFSGSISNVRVVKGTAVYTAPFTPSSTALTAITNTQLLTLQNATIVDNSSNAFTLTNTGTVATATATPFVANITSDASGQNNGWTSNNINYTSSGTTYDSMIDSPTNYADGGNGRGNYAVLNPLSNPNGPIYTISNGNLNYSCSASAGNAPKMAALSSIAMYSGKFYCEATETSTNSVFGINSGLVSGGTANGPQYAAVYNGGTIASAATYSGTTPTFTTNDIIGFAFDAGALTLQIFKNGTSLGTLSGIEASVSNWFFTQSVGTGSSATSSVWNFGQQPFRGMYVSGSGSSYVGTGAPPSGFSALNTQNLPTPTIANGAQYMAATTYAGTGSTQQIFPGASGVSYGNNPLNISFQPDLVWIRNINAASGGMLLDTLRGSSVFLQTTNTNSEGSNTGDFVSFNANGFSVGGNGNLANQTTNNFVGWQWNAGGTTVAGTGTGGITNVSYRANLTAGFSIVKWTGSGAAGTITHGLTTAPTFMIIKERNNSRSWPVWHSSIPNMQTSYIYFDNAGTLGTGYGGFWNSLAPTNSIINVGSDPTTNESAKDFIAFCFTDVSAYSKFGAYTGNGATGTAGSADGPFVYLGFRPRFIIIRRADTVTAGNFVIIDTSRDTYNVSQNALLPDSVNAQSTGWYLDVLSNGFKIRVLGTAANMNSSGITYIYAAFAENPFRNARAR